MEERTIYPMQDDDTITLSQESRLMRHARPAHFTFKIESFSVLSEFLSTIGEKKYESRDFEAGGYEWRLALYPNGDDKRNGTDHISLYLVLSATNNLPNHLEVNTFFKLFVYDQIRDKYLTVEDVSKKQQRFHALKTECGFSRFLPLVTFKDEANGYLVDDCCIFGAEVIITNCTGIGETVSIKKPESDTFTFKWKKFSKLDKEFYKSSEFTNAGWEWCIRMLPNSDGDGNLGLFLELTDASKLLPGQKVYVKYKLRVKNQLGGQPHYDRECSKAFGSAEDWGFNKFLVESDLKDMSKGFLVNDTLIVECEFILAVEVKKFS